jgi:hypothetical protein
LNGRGSVSPELIESAHNVYHVSINNNEWIICVWQDASYSNSYALIQGDVIIAKAENMEYREQATGDALALAHSLEFGTPYNEEDLRKYYWKELHYWEKEPWEDDDE